MGEKIEKSDYFANPKKDVKKRPGRPPGRKNNKTLEAEKKRKDEEVKKGKKDIIGIMSPDGDSCELDLSKKDNMDVYDR